MRLNGEISIGSLVTALSVLVSAAAIVYGWRKDRQLRRRAYADQMRGAAGRIAALLERWPIVVLQSFADLEPLAIEVGRMAAGGAERSAIRHALRKGLYEQRAAVARRVADERLEMAYVDLYGYDPRIHALFLGAVQRLKTIDQQAFQHVHDLIERAVGAQAEDPAAGTNDLGATLCGQFDALASAYEAASKGIIDGFRAEMLKLILADDDRILTGRVAFAPAAQALPDPILREPCPGGDGVARGGLAGGTTRRADREE